MRPAISTTSAIFTEGSSGSGKVAPLTIENVPPPIQARQLKLNEVLTAVHENLQNAPNQLVHEPRDKPPSDHDEFR